MLLRSSVSVVSLCVISGVLAGCSSTFEPTLTNDLGKASVGDIKGIAHGGQQAISGAHVYVYEVSATGYGGAGIAAATGNASKSLLVASSGANPTTVDGSGNYYVTSGGYGQFGLGGDYTCDVGSEVYLYISGGNPGLAAGTNNTGIGELAALGICPAAGNLAATVPYVYVNEVSTVAMAYALAGFATDATHIGTTGSALAKVGLANAFATVNNLAKIDTGAALSVTPANGTNGMASVVPHDEINTLANIIAACINTTSAASTQCTTLFANAKNTLATPSAPTDTASAMINMAHSPATNVATLYGLQAGVGAPFVTDLSSAPTDWAIRLTFKGGGITNLDGQPQALAVDGSGNLWSVGYFGTVLSKFSNLGVPANTSGYALSLNGPSTVAVDANSTHVWISNFATDSGDGFLSNFNISTSTGSAHIGAGGNGSTAPIALGIDGSGNVWVSNYDGNSSTASNVVKMNTSGTVLSTVGQASVGNKITSPVWMAFEPGATGDTWIANEDPNGAARFSTSGAYASSSTLGGQLESQSAAIDSSGNVWLTNLNGNNLSKLNNTGTTGASYALGIPAGDQTSVSSLAIDGAGNVWAVNNSQNSLKPVDNAVFELTNAGVAKGPTNGYPSSPTSLCPGAVVVDGSGNVWFQTNVVDGQNAALAPATLVEMVGIGVPVVTPLAYGVANNLLGTRP